VRKERKPLKKVLIGLFEGDFERLQELYAPASASKIIREMVSAHLRRVDQIANLPSETEAIMKEIDG